MRRRRIVIIGGGFAGVICARICSRKLGRQSEVTLFDRQNHLVFTPLLAEVAGSSIDPRAVAAPLREMLPLVECRTEPVRHIDFAAREIQFEDAEGVLQRMAYEHVVLACGSEVNLGLVPGMADHAYPLRTIGDALLLRARVMGQLEKADVCEDAEKRRLHLTFIVIGGGFSGVEVAGEINDLIRGSRRFFRNIGTQDVRVVIVHSRQALLPEVGSRLRAFAGEKMVEAGIELILGARVSVVTGEGVGLTDGRMIHGATVVSTVGNTVAPLVIGLAAEKLRGRLATEPDLRLLGQERAWAIGDCAHVVNAEDGKPCPATGQFAEREGARCARNILLVLRSEPTRAFSYAPIGQLCAIGGRKAVAEIKGLRLSGFFAWWLWRTIYLLKMPSVARRMKIILDWTWDLVFARDLTYLQSQQTERIGHAHFSPGDTVFEVGAPARDFYIIEKGEVEVVRPLATGEEQIVAILGPGDFFGEMALLADRPRRSMVRARTPLEVVVLGRQVFSRISGALSPLRKIVGAAVRRRSGSWLRLPSAAALLQSVPVAELQEPLAAEPLRADTPLREAVARLSREPVDLLSVIDEKGKLIGVLTRSDLLRAIETLAAAPADSRPRLLVQEVMVADPLALKEGDSLLTAVSTMREHGLKKLLVLAEDGCPVGCLRIETVMSRILERLEKGAVPGS